MRHIYRLALMLIGIISANVPVLAQCDPILRHDSTQWIFNSTVLSSAKAGNVLYLGGNFTTIGKRTGSFVSVNAVTGKPVDLANWPKANGAVNAIIPDGSGGFIIGGTFTQIGPATRNGIAQVNAAGQVSSWNPNCDGQVSTLFKSGTTVFVGGSFTTIGGQSRANVAAIDMTTGNATSWNPGTNGAVNKIVESSGIVYMGGSFTTAAGQSRNRIAAIDASTAAASSWNPSPNGTVITILINGSIAYVGGAFTTIGGQSRTNAAAISLSTGLATSWAPSPNGVVYDMVMSSSNTILVGGQFSSIGSQLRIGVGEVDNNFGNATSTNYALPSGQVYSIKISGNDIYLAGLFSLSSGQSNLVKINKALGTIAAWECNLGNTGYPFAIELNATGTTLYAGGTFAQYYKNRSRLAAIDMLTDSLMDWNPAVNNTVNSIAANNNSVFIGGTFIQAGGQARNRLAEISAATGIATSWNPNASGSVTTVVLNGNTLYVGGFFTTISSTNRNRAAAYNITTGALTSWNPNVNGTVNAMLISGSNMYLGGSFTTINGGTARNRIASVNLSTNAVTGWNPNADGTVNTLAAANGVIYAGGSFNNIGGQFRPRLAALSETTGNATAWDPYPNGTITRIALDGARIYAGGSYTNNGGQSRNNLAAIDTTGTGNATSWDPSPNNTINYVAVHDGRMIVSGGFNQISGMPYSTVAQYKLLETSPSVVINGKTAVCASTPVTFTAYTDVTGASYQWKRNGSNVGTNSATYTVTPANNDQIQVVITTPIGSCYAPATATSNTLTISIAAAVTPSVSISGSTTVCAGAASTYIATTNVPNPTYVWRVNSNPAGTNSTSFTYTPANGDVVTCTVHTPPDGCFTASSATSTPVNITVNIPVAPTITIATASTTVCASTPVTFNATTNVTGGSYQWKVNGINVGTNNAAYTTSSLANGSVVTCVITIPAGGCFTASTATSNGLTMTVTPNVTATLSISGNTSPCSGASATYTATTNVTGASYQWKVNGINAGTNSTTFSYVPANGNVVTCVVTAAAGNCFAPLPVTSNSLTITPMALVTPTATVTGSNNLCQGSSGSYTVTTNVTGGTYQWKVNGSNQGTNPGFSYTPANGDIVTCVVTTPPGQGCYSAASVTSNNFTVTVNNPVLPSISIVEDANNICSGTIVNYSVSSTNVTGGFYQWRVNGFNIPGATSSTFSYVPSNGNVISCRITVPAGGCFLASSVFSNNITMVVAPSTTPTIGILAGSNNVCAGTMVSFTAVTNISGGTFQWKVNGVNVGTNSATFNYAPTNNDIVTCTITVPGTGCFTVPVANSNAITMQVQSLTTPMVTVSPSATTVCEGVTVFYTATTNVPGATYIWKVNGNTVGTNSDVFSYAPANSDIVLCFVIVPPGCYTQATASSTIIVMNVNSSAEHTFNIAGPGIAEMGSQVTVQANVQSNITSYSIEWKSNGVPFDTTTTATATFTKAAGIDNITATITPAITPCHAVVTAGPVVIYSVGTGVDDQAKQGGLSVYPNPFADRITIKGLLQGDQVTIYDMAGKRLQVWIADKDQPEHTFMIRDLAQGSYMLRVTDKNNYPKGNMPLQKL